MVLSLTVGWVWVWVLRSVGMEGGGLRVLGAVGLQAGA